MAIETLDDIYEEIMNGLGVYGSHDERCEQGRGSCRCCYSSQLASRIREAFYVDEAMKGRSQ